MDIHYPVSEILECIEDINVTKKKIDKYNYKTFTLNNAVDMKKKMKQTQGTFGEPFEIEEMAEDTFDDAEPFEIDEITKIDNSEIEKKETAQDILLLTDEVTHQDSLQKMNKNDQNVEQISKLNDQISVLKERNAKLGDSVNQISKAINQQGGNKELQTKLEILYEQQNVIKDYESQILQLKEKNHLLEQKFELPPSWLTGDLKYNHTPKNDSNEVPQILSQDKYEEELKTKSKIIYEQQNIINDNQKEISKLREEHRLLQQKLEVKNNSDQITDVQLENSKTEAEDMVRRIKYYQDDNLRLSNEVVKLSNKLENSKNQLEHFENNKAKLVSQLENLNNIVSESNVIGSPFDTTISKVENNLEKVEDKLEVKEKIPDEKKTIRNKFQSIIRPVKIKNSEEMNRQTKEIFKK